MRPVARLAVCAVLLAAACGTAPVSEWARVPDDPASLGGPGFQSMESVTGGGPGLVAVGWNGAGNQIDAAVWTSADGLNWSRVSHDPTVFGSGGGAAMSGVSPGGPGLVAVGWDAAGGDQDGAVWTSADGLSWSRVPGDEAVFGGTGDQWIFSVAAGGPGLVAVGHDMVDGDPDAAVWTSADGLSWSRVSHNEAVMGGQSGQAMFGVANAGAGLVAVGWDASGGEADAAVWKSVDGLNWSRVSHDEAVFGGPGDQEMVGVGVGGPGLVAMGWDSSGGDQDGAVWTSPDGSTWSRVSHDEAVFGGAGEQEVVSVVATDSGLVAVGWDTSGGDQDAAAWTSRDGVAWERAPQDEALFGGPGQQWMLGIAAGPDGVVGVGWDALGNDADAAVWVMAGAG